VTTLCALDLDVSVCVWILVRATGSQKPRIARAFPFDTEPVRRTFVLAQLHRAIKSIESWIAHAFASIADSVIRTQFIHTTRGNGTICSRKADLTDAHWKELVF